MTDVATDILHAILADPDDDTPRLIYADHLEESGDVERAAFIRLQIRLSELVRQEPEDCGAVVGVRHAPSLCNHCQWSYEIMPLNEAQFGLVKRNKEAWLPVRIEKPWAYYYGRFDACRIGVKDTFAVTYEYRRGFVESVHASYAWLLQNYDTLRERTPLKSVDLGSLPRVLTNGRGEYQLDNKCKVLGGVVMEGWHSVYALNLPGGVGQYAGIAQPLVQQRWPDVVVTMAKFAREPR